MFLRYATDPYGKSPPNYLPYPEHAQAVEHAILGPSPDTPDPGPLILNTGGDKDRGVSRGQGGSGVGVGGGSGGRHRMGMGESNNKKEKNSLESAPYTQALNSTSFSTSTFLFVSTSNMVRYAYDYSLCPDLVSEKTLRNIIEEMQNRGHLGLPQTPHSPSPTRFPSPPPSTPFPRKNNSNSNNENLNLKTLKGLSFCDFLEVIATVVLEGLSEQERDIFPTPFSKVNIYSK